MAAHILGNKRNAGAHFGLTFDQCPARGAIGFLVGDAYIQHNPRKGR